jgi:DNA-binding NtrC family response regulator
VSRRFQILVVDRNPNVRRFLTRELVAAGFDVRAFENACELLEGLAGKPAPNLVVLDPDLPDTDGPSLFVDLQQQAPKVPVVIHTFLSDWNDTPPYMTRAAAFVEKGANSIEKLIREVRRLCGAADRSAPGENVHRGS